MNDSVELVWHHSSKCTAGNCVEVAKSGDAYLLRDSKSPDIAPLRLDADEWGHFRDAVVRGEFDVR
ncbi:DUF397 domain-containing protein [Actinoplanes sp. NPDC051494]|uniref:DUF397 domain-containing protein n=1 Tax=Actinoplanes sp. NPDC051494 TaxID=3363907 RepID=UPI00378D2005